MFLYRIDGILVFSFLERKTLECWLKINNKVFKTTTSISRETIRDKNFFKKSFFLKFVLQANFFQLWAKQFGRGCQNYIRRVQRNIVRLFHWKKDDFSYLFPLWAESLLTTAKHLRQGFRNFNLRVRKKILREKKMKKDDFLVFLYFEWKKLEIGRTNFGRVCQKCILRVQGSS